MRIAIRQNFVIFTVYTLIALYACLPSILIYLSSCETSCIINYSIKNVLFEEKFWIYYLEFKRSTLLGMLSWPSLNENFNSVIYLERLLPRLLYYPIVSHQEIYFLYDAIVIFILMVFSQYSISKKLNFIGVNQLIFPLCICLISIYDFRFPFLEPGVAESWFSRNPVAILALTLSLWVVFDNNEGGTKLNGTQLSIIFLALAATHTYTYMLIMMSFLLRSIYDDIYMKKISYSRYLLLVPSIFFLVFVNFNLRKSVQFTEFKLYYGMQYTDSFNYLELAKLFLLGLLLVLIDRTKEAKLCIYVFISAMILTNIQVVTNEKLRDIHYRIYILEWIFSIVFVKYFFNKFKIKNIYPAASVIVFILALRSFLYISNFDYKCDSPNVNEDKGYCNPNISMTGALIRMTPQQLLQCQIFIWDVPEISKMKANLAICNNSNESCLSWRRASIHLHN